MPLQEVIITKIQTPKTIFDVSAGEPAELSNAEVSANIVAALMTPKNASPRRHDAGVTTV